LIAEQKVDASLLGQNVIDRLIRTVEVCLDLFPVPAGPWIDKWHGVFPDLPSRDPRFLQGLDGACRELIGGVQHVSAQFSRPLMGDRQKRRE
jgi:hypothetical protein